MRVRFRCICGHEAVRDEAGFADPVVAKSARFICPSHCGGDDPYAPGYDSMTFLRYEDEHA